MCFGPNMQCGNYDDNSWLLLFNSRLLCAMSLLSAGRYRTHIQFQKSQKLNTRPRIIASTLTGV